MCHFYLVFCLSEWIPLSFFWKLMGFKTRSFFPCPFPFDYGSLKQDFEKDLELWFDSWFSYGTSELYWCLHFSFIVCG